MKKKNKTIGIIGGMGPYASSYFYRLLLKKSGEIYHSINNNDYPEILLDSVPVPDFISDTKHLAVARKMLVSRVKKMNNFGCSTLAMTCNTGHILYENLSLNSKAEFVSLIDITAKKAQEMNLKRVGVLATQTTIRLKLYDKALSTFGIEVFYPVGQAQKIYEKIIRSVIAGRAATFSKKLFQATREFVKNNKLDGIILGCTELPLVFPKHRFNNIIDGLDVLAKELLMRYYGDGKEAK